MTPSKLLQEVREKFEFNLILILRLQVDQNIGTKELTIPDQIREILVLLFDCLLVTVTFDLEQ